MNRHRAGMPARVGLLLVPTLALCATCAPAQDAEIQRALIERQQQSEAFSLQLRQSVEAGRLAPGDARTRGELEATQLRERQDFEALSGRQLREATQPLSPDPETARQLRPYATGRAADERRLQLPPPVRQPAPRAAPPLPLPGAPRRGVDPVLPERLPD